MYFTNNRLKQKITVLLIFMLFAGLSLNAQVLTTGSPEEVGMSSERLKRMDNMLQSAISKNEIPGAVALVARKGKIVYLKSFGAADSDNRALKADDIFRIASMTKAITSTAVMMLYEEGKFHLEDPISKWIPEFKNPQVLDSLLDDGTYTTIKADKEISIRHLLTHTSGLGYGEIDADERMKRIYKDAGIKELYSTEAIRIQDVAKEIAKLPLHHDPGEKFTYGVSLDVLGALVEIVSGKPLDQFFEEYIFEPLGMNDTYFYLDEERAKRLVQVQTKKEGEFEPLVADFYDVDFPIKGAKTFFSGGAGLSSTAEDYAKFLQMYLNNGMYNGKRLLSRKTIELIMSKQVDDLYGEGAKHYGLAFSVVYKQGGSWASSQSVGTFIWGGYFNTYYMADPEEDIIAILMKQTFDIGLDTTTLLFQQIVYQAIND
ncbi:MULTISPECIES: serine hydrolase domain-containing protein [Flavobacteriaceae]|uniref:serine hydrolase domain-containing protein n=1 Tax=Flavobacteriaceae TaxID=49546 RepID=UPI0014908FDC|nr:MULTISPECIES: serine hydrolase [Allomuricauda]MDC6367317.1 serine hydrolase [Muricauda sp. AC10]